MEHRFYQFSKTPLPIAVAKLADRVNGSKKALNIVAGENWVKRIDDALWEQLEFLPHSIGEPDGLSKVLISEAPQPSDVYFFLNDLNFDDVESELICYLFHNADQDVVASRRQDWKSLNDSGVHLTYWAENENGAWEKKAEANVPQSAPKSE